MPVDLHLLPEKLMPSEPARTVGWLLLVLSVAILGGASALLLWPGEWQPESPWFWCCVLVFPVLVGTFLYGLHLLAHESRQTYVDSWNAARAALQLEMTTLGQQAVGVLSASYCSPVGNHQLAQQLREGAKPLQMIFQPSDSSTLRWSPVVDEALKAADKLSQRLESSLHQVMAVLAVNLKRVLLGEPVQVRIRHNQTMRDDEVLALWNACARSKAVAVESVSITNEDDGLLWLDAWLDRADAFELVLSVEINLFGKPTAEQAESVSAVLLARSGYCSQKGVSPVAWVHRPVAMSSEPHSARQLLLWGRIDPQSKPFVWESQLPDADRVDAQRALHDAGCSLDHQAWLRLDDSLGLPGCAAGNVALILASEQAAASQEPQLFMLQDETPQWCVVQPAH